ncbi:MAG TPA: hypothetical protein VGM18_03990 [Candidatus Sulfotelmatobacter sp.]|jgi:hypothetical protein
MKNEFAIARRELFKKLVGAAGAVGLAALLPTSASAEGGAAPGAVTATVRVILATGSSVQWMAVTSGGLTVGGQTALTAGTGLNNNIVKAAIAAIIAAGGPKLSAAQVVLLGGQV